MCRAFLVLVDIVSFFEDIFVPVFSARFSPMVTGEYVQLYDVCFRDFRYIPYKLS